VLLNHASFAAALFGATCCLAVEALPEPAVLAGLIAGGAACTVAHVTVAQTGLEAVPVSVPGVVVGPVVPVAFTLAGVVLVLRALLGLLVALLLVPVTVPVAGLLFVILRLTASLAPSSATPEGVGVLDRLIDPHAC
jgi:hypothetical protein